MTYVENMSCPAAALTYSSASRPDRAFKAEVIYVKAQACPSVENVSIGSISLFALPSGSYNGRRLRDSLSAEGREVGRVVRRYRREHRLPRMFSRSSPATEFTLFYEDAGILSVKSDFKKASAIQIPFTGETLGSDRFFVRTRSMPPATAAPEFLVVISPTPCCQIEQTFTNLVPGAVDEPNLIPGLGGKASLLALDGWAFGGSLAIRMARTLRRSWSLEKTYSPG
jgi:hypothetical protein